ncbi:MAG: SurA N-terminal domain-containing protein [Nitrospirota bacterium]
MGPVAPDGPRPRAGRPRISPGAGTYGIKEDEHARRVLMRKFVYVLLATGLLWGCTQGAKESETSGAYLAKVDGTAITEQDVQSQYDMLPPQVQEVFAEQGGKARLIDELVKKEMLYQEARKADVQKDEKFKERLAEFKKRLMIEILLQKEIGEKSKVSDQEVRDFYEKNKERFSVGKQGEKGSEPIEFETVRKLLKERLQGQKQQEAFESYVDSLKKKYTVERNEEAIRAAFGNAPEPGSAPTPSAAE